MLVAFTAKNNVDLEAARSPVLDLEMQFKYMETKSQLYAKRKHNYVLY